MDIKPDTTIQLTDKYKVIYLKSIYDNERIKKALREIIMLVKTTHHE